MYPKHTNQQPYCGFFSNFASEVIADKMYDKMIERCYDKLKEYVVVNVEDTNSAGFRGTLFEKFCHRLWSSPGREKLKG